MTIPVLDDIVAVVSPLITELAGLLGPVGGAAAIAVCTITLRLLLLPLTLTAVRGERARAALAPQVAELRKRHGTDLAALGPELSALHRDAGVSPFAGLWPMLAQAPFLMVWFRVFTVPGTDGGLLGQRFLGAGLAEHVTAAPLAFTPLLVALAAVGAATIWRSRRVAAVTGNPPPHGLFAVLPFVSVLSALFLPLAAVVYLVTTLTWTFVESVVLRRGLPARPSSPPAAPAVA